MSGNTAADGRQMSCVLWLSQPLLSDRSDPRSKWLVFVVSCHFSALNFNKAHLLRRARRLPSLRTAEYKHVVLTQIKMITLAFQYWFQQPARCQHLMGGVEERLWYHCSAEWKEFVSTFRWFRITIIQSQLFKVFHGVLLYLKWHRVIDNNNRQTGFLHIRLQ